MLSELSSGKITIDEAERRIRLLAVREMEIACLDLSREARKGVPEIVLAEGKDDASLKKIVRAFLEESGRVIVTRISEEKLEALRSAWRKSLRSSTAQLEGWQSSTTEEVLIQKSMVQYH